MNVIYGVNSKYVIPALVSIFSVSKHTSKPVDFVIFGDQIEDDISIEAIMTVSDKCNLNISLRSFDADLFQEYKQLDGKKFPAVSLLPLMLPSLIDDRCLFLDADTLIMGDVINLFEADLEGKLIGACLDIGQATYVRDRFSRLRASDVFRPRYAQQKRKTHLLRVFELGFIPDENYFNSGVLLMDCPAIRKSSLDLEDLVNAKRLRPYHAFMPDQDRLNEFFFGKWFQFPLKWNTRPAVKKDVGRRLKTRFRDVSKNLVCQMQEAASDPKIWHFMGSKKPWEKKWRKLMFMRQAYQDYHSLCCEFEDRTGIKVDVT
ncbi:MAG: hypothetical protein OXE94_04410 [Aestuariivita sp.]|nr:hypothetical protein [Aestuariivita sp.]MCY4202723.1 hypothetical protein [Aestuariivita sp.]